MKRSFFLYCVLLDHVISNLLAVVYDYIDHLMSNERV